MSLLDIINSQKERILILEKENLELRKDLDEIIKQRNSEEIKVIIENSEPISAKISDNHSQLFFESI